MNATPISVAITTRAIRGNKTYEAEYNGVNDITLYQIEPLNGNQEMRTHIAATKVKEHLITGWAGLVDIMENLIDHHISPLLKELKTT